MWQANKLDFKISEQCRSMSSICSSNSYSQHQKRKDQMSLEAHRLGTHNLNSSKVFTGFIFILLKKVIAWQVLLTEFGYEIMQNNYIILTKAIIFI